MLGVLVRRVVERHDPVADVLVDGAPVAEDDFGHHGEVLAKHLVDLLRLQTLRDGREPANVGEEDGDEAPAGVKAPPVAIADHRAQDVGREEPRQPLLLALLAHEILDDRRAVAEHQPEGDRDAAHPHVGQGEDREGNGHTEREQQAGDGQRANRAQPDDQHGPDERGEDRQDGRREPGHLADRIAVDERLEGIGVDHDPRHVTAAGERRGEDVVQHLAGGSDQHDLVAEQVLGDLVADDAVVRHAVERLEPAAEVDQRVLARRQRPRGKPLQTHLAMQLGVERQPPFVALHRIGHARAHGNAADVTVGIRRDVEWGDGRGPFANDRQRHVHDLACGSPHLLADRVERLVVLGQGQTEHDVSRAGHGRAQHPVVLGSEHRVAVEDDVEADDERPVGADAVDDLAVQRTGKWPLEIELLKRRFVDRDDDDRRGRLARPAKLEELIEPERLPPLDRAEQHEGERDGGRCDADEIFPDLAEQARPEPTHLRNSKPALPSGPHGSDGVNRPRAGGPSFPEILI